MFKFLFVLPPALLFALFPQQPAGSSLDAGGCRNTD